MKLPLPQDRWADCVWLPRIIAKARALQRGELPPEYAERFCHPNGVDGQFLAHFGFTREDIVAAAALADAEAQAWLRQRAAPEKIAAWNHTALNLGRPGFPLAERFPVALATTYKHLAGRGFTSVFEILAADEAEG
jgi:hypothetical protein